jgi:hypothetical protein
VEKTEKIWELYYKLLTLAMQSNVQINEEEWIAEAIPFGQVFVDRYCAEEITTYIHIFIYHIGFFLAKFNSVEKFANYAIEGMHSVNKTNQRHQTSNFKNTPNSNITKQQLQITFREDWYQFHNILSKPPSKYTHTTPKRKRESWATKTLKIVPEMQKYIINTK